MSQQLRSLREKLMTEQIDYVENGKVDQLRHAEITERARILNTPPVMTYDLLVLATPETPSTYTSGAVGDAEKEFYIAHRDIEAHFRQSIDRVFAIAEATDRESNPVYAEEALEHFTKGVERLASLRSQSHFDEFRPYFVASPYHQYPGPSGAQSAAISTFDNLFLETVPDLAASKEMYPNIDPFRYATWNDIMYASNIRMRKGIITEFDRPSDTILALNQIRDKLVNFRGAHMGLARKFVGNQPGTGGSDDAMIYLKNRYDQSKRK